MKKNISLSLISAFILIFSCYNLNASGNETKMDMKEDRDGSDNYSLRRRNVLPQDTKKQSKLDDELSEDYFNSGIKKYKTKDYDEAFRLLMKAATLGHAKAQYNVGILYENGIGTEASLKEAGTWYTYSAAQGNKEANASLERIISKSSSKAYLAISGVTPPGLSVLTFALAIEKAY